MPDSDKSLDIFIRTFYERTGFVLAREDAAAMKSEFAEIEKGFVPQNMSESQAQWAKFNETLSQTNNKFIEGRHEVKMLGNEVAQTFGLGNIGGFLLGGMLAAVTAVIESVKFLKWSWSQMADTISGPIDIGLPPDTPKHISAVSEAWNQYITVRDKVLAEQNTPQAVESAREKHLANELKLIKEVLAAEKQKALADLESRKSSLTPDAYQAEKNNIESAYGDANKSAEESNRIKDRANKVAEAASLEITAHEKLQKALKIKHAPQNVAETMQKYLDDEASKSAAALKVINDRIALLERLSNPENQLEYTGPLGAVKRHLDNAAFHFRYGDWASLSDALEIEETRKTQAQAAIDRASDYKTRQDSAQKTIVQLTAEAGQASSQAAAIRKGISVDDAENLTGKISPAFTDALKFARAGLDGNKLSDDQQQIILRIAQAASGQAMNLRAAEQYLQQLEQMPKALGATFDRLTQFNQEVLKKIAQLETRINNQRSGN